MTPGQQQIDEVQACDEQNDHRHDHQKQGETRRERATAGTRHEHETRGHRHLERVAGVDRRKRLLEPTGHGRECGRGSLDRRARPEPPHNGQLVRLARTERAPGRHACRSERIVRAKGQPHLWPGDARPGESLRSHTDDRELLAVDPNGPAEHARVGATSLPEWITDDRDTDISSEPFFLRA